MPGNRDKTQSKKTGEKSAENTPQTRSTSGRNLITNFMGEDATMEGGPSTSPSRETDETFEAFMRRSISGIQHSLNRVELKQHDFLERITKLDRGERETHESIEYSDKEVADLKQNLQKVNKKVSDLCELVKQLQLENNKLTERVLDSERYSRSYNLRFGGIEEKEGENPKEILKKIIEKDLNIHNVHIENVHRIGGPKKEGQTRHILAKFLYRSERGEVLFAGKQKLKGTEKNVTEDLITEDKLKKNMFKDFMAKSYREGKKVRFVRGRLYVDGREIHESQVDKL